MRTSRRPLTGSLVGVLLAAMLPGVAAADVVDGRPGRIEISAMTIDATTQECQAWYVLTVEGNAYVRGEQADVHVVVNRNGVHATCRFTDVSGIVEANAEVGYTDACTLVTDEQTWSDGMGRVTAAADMTEGSDGGQSIITCRFRTAPESAASSSEAHAPAGHVATFGGATHERDKPVQARGPQAGGQPSTTGQRPSTPPTGKAKGSASRAKPSPGERGRGR